MSENNCHCGHTPPEHDNNICQSEGCKCEYLITSHIPRRPIEGSGNIKSAGYHAIAQTAVIEYSTREAVYFYNHATPNQWIDFEKTFDDPKLSTGSFAAKTFRKLPNFGRVVFHQSAPKPAKDERIHLVTQIYSKTYCGIKPLKPLKFDVKITPFFSRSTCQNCIDERQTQSQKTKAVLSEGDFKEENEKQT